MGVLKNKNKFHVQNIIEENKVFLLLWFSVPILLPFALSAIFPEQSITGFIQYIMFATPPYFILVSKGISESGKFKSIILALVVLLSIIPLYSYYTNYDKQQWREAAIYLTENSRGTELILLNAPNNVLPFSYYYKNLEKVKGIRNAVELLPLIREEKSFWLVYSSEKFYDPNYTIKKYLDTGYKLDKQTELTGIKIYHYRKNSFT